MSPAEPTEPTEPTSSSSSSSSSASSSSSSSSPSSQPSLSSPATAKKPWPRWAMWARDIAITFVFVVAAREIMAEVRAPNIAMNAPAPVTTGTTLSGQRFDLTSLRGTPVVVNVWASWCGPCRGELPDLAAAARAHPEARFVGLVVTSSDRADARALVAEHALPYDNVFIDAESERRWNISSVPSTVVLDANGNVVWRRSGAVDEGDIAGALRKLKR